MPTTFELFATACFALALIHTFSVKFLQNWARRFPEGSVEENVLHLLGEVEVVFGLWALVLLLFLTFTQGSEEAIHFMESKNFTEPAFVFVIMTVCSTRPILALAGRLIESASHALPFPRPTSFYITALVLGPLLGSFITEPAAMTVTALILLERFYEKGIPAKLKYATLGLLFVNVSIGGVLTPYAAPPVLMVAKVWDWDLSFMATTFGWKAALALTVSTLATAFRFRKALGKLDWEKSKGSKKPEMPLWVSLTHLVFLALIVLTSHHLVVFAGIFLFFLGLATVTREYQSELKLREGMLVAFFLGGLVILGSPQRWWLEPLITELQALPLYLGASALTAITDNAALTYLGSQVPDLSEASKYALVAGAVTGGGLTVIANAPNPAGYGILNPSFGRDGISPSRLFLAALAPTLVAAFCFWILK